ncbi:uncharacterized protein LOC135694446 isoform X1 [Rhopilema esculentum]|uniref:uncharacterized protein LOC135694446 isoform X1 n=1 Tax=Rhopilema esculentum TaxID=499914 RepID=UPI0031E2DDA5
MLLITILISLAANIRTQEITTTGCGTTKACIKEPTSCTTSANCQFLATWKRKAGDDSTMEFEISSNAATGWVALGFNAVGPQMVSTKGEICYISGSQKILKGFHATSKSRPNFQSPASNTMMQSLEVINGAIICRFSRPLVGSDYQNSITSSIYPIFASGDISSGTVQYHSARKALAMVNFSAFTNNAMTTSSSSTIPTITAQATSTTISTATATTSIATATTTAPLAMTTATTSSAYSEMMKANAATTTVVSPTTSFAVSSTYSSPSMPYNTTTPTAPPLTIDLSTCGKSKGCFKIPSGCNTVSSCRFVVTWMPDQDKKQVRFELKGSENAWVAFGLNAGARAMPGTYGEICYMSGSTAVVKAFKATARTLPAFSSSQPNGITVHGFAKSGGTICSYTRPWVKTDNSYSTELNKEAYIIVASGNSVNGGVPSYHLTAKGSSGSKFNMAKAIGNSNSASKKETNLLVLVAVGTFCAMLLALVM